MDIEKRIKELRLIPLFPDKNFNYTSFDLNDVGKIIEIIEFREEENLRLSTTLFYGARSTSEKYVILGRVYNYENGEDYLKISEDYKNIGLFDAVNKFNFNYEILAKKFNELLLKELKEELEKEKEKAKEEEKAKEKEKAKEEEKAKEQGGDEQGGDEQGGDEQGGDEQGGDEQGGDEQGGDEQGGDEQGGDEQGGDEQGGDEQGGDEQGGDEQGGDEQGGDEQGGDEQGGDEQGGDEQGGDEQGGDEQGGDEQGGDGKMSSKDIQKLIDQLNNQIDNKDTNGQSNDQAIDLEDFLKKVEEGKIDNDFSKYRNDKGLKAEIDIENQPEPSGLEFLDENYQKEFEEKSYKSIIKALKEKLKIEGSEIKRRFPTPDFVRDFVFLLGKNEVEDLSNRIGIEKEMPLNDKKSIIATNLITELQNI